MSNSRRVRRSVTPTRTDRPGEAAVERAGGYPQPGAVNGYRCDDCHRITLIRHADAGVTPMFLACRAGTGCQGRSVSLGYPDGPPPSGMGRIEWEWYRPERGAAILRDPAMRSHVEQGGLALRRIGTVDDDSPLRPLPGNLPRACGYCRQIEGHAAGCHFAAAAGLS